MGKILAKTYRAYQPSAFIMGIFSLLFAGTFAAFLFFPVWTADLPTEYLEYNGFDFFILGGGTYLQQIIGEVDTTRTDLILAIFNDPHSENFVVNLLSGFHWIFELVFAALAALSFVFAALVALLGLFWFIRGRILIPKSTLTFCRLAHGAYDSAIGAFYGYIFIVSDLALNAAEPGTVAMTPYPFIILGVQMACTIIMHITFRMCYRRRVFDNSKKESDDDPISNAPGAPTKGDRYKPIYEKGIPETTTHIGDHAYAGDNALTRVVIPDGVPSLGNNAFANCRNLETITIPVSVRKIGANCFNNTPHLTQINYNGGKEDWRNIKRGANWLVGSGTSTIITREGAIVVNPNQ